MPNGNEQRNILKDIRQIVCSFSCADAAYRLELLYIFYCLLIVETSLVSVPIRYANRFCKPHYHRASVGCAMGALVAKDRLCTLYNQVRIEIVLVRIDTTGSQVSCRRYGPTLACKGCKYRKSLVRAIRHGSSHQYFSKGTYRNTPESKFISAK